MSRSATLRRLATTLLLGLALATAYSPPAASQPAEEPAPTPPAAIPLPEVASRAESDAARLRELESRVVPLPAIEKIAEALPVLSRNIDQHLTETAAAVNEDPVLSLDFLDDLESEWRFRLQTLDGWGAQLTRRAIDLEKELTTLGELATLWQSTRVAARKDGAPTAVRGRIDAVLASIAKATKQVGSRRDQVLTLQSQGSGQRTRVATALEQVLATRERAVGALFAAAAAPVWSGAFRDGLRDDLGQDLSDVLGAQWEDVRSWAEGRGSRFLLHALLALALVMLLVPARRKLREAQEVGPGLEHAEPIFEQPAATVLLLALLASPWGYSQAPRVVLELLYAAVLIPAVLVLRHLVSQRLRPLLFAIVGFFLVDRVREILEPLTELERAIFLVEMAVAIGLLVFLLRPSRLARIPSEAARSPVLRRAGAGARIALVILIVTFVTESMGYARLARLLGDAVFGSAYAAVVAYAAVRIMSVLLRFGLRVQPLRRLHMAIHHRTLLERRGDRALRWIGGAAWAWITLDLLALGQPALDAGRRLMGGALTIGAVSVSLGDVLAFVLTVWAAFLISRFLRFVLEEDVFPRTRMRRGMPYALSTLLHYGILFFGFLLAVAAAGIQLDRIAFLAGAFGVGLGFGLQNVVNNFVSGIILLFERPIQRGDMVQMGTLWGEVRRIGIRASVVRTFDGAEVIVPNGTLLSEQLTNWTLSDHHRRIQVEVGVAYGTDPERVLEILRTVATESADVLTTPEPVTLFLGFGESSLDFRLQAWIANFDRGLSVRSDLTVAVNRALADAGIEIPFPQRDLHLRSAAPEVKGLLGEGAPAEATSPGAGRLPAGGARV